MNTTVSTGTRGPGPGSRAPRRPAPRRDDPRRQDRRRQDQRRQDQRRPAPRREGPEAGPRTPGPGRAAAAGRRTGPAPDTQGRARRPVSRTPFILLVLALLGGGLVCLLVINTTLAAASFRISNLQKENTEAAQRVQELQQQVSTDQSANSIEQRAIRLGMRTQPTLNVVDLQTGRKYTTPARVPGVYAVPGYTP
jgi:cell division protein FtsB